MLSNIQSILKKAKKSKVNSSAASNKRIIGDFDKVSGQTEKILKRLG